MFDGLSKNKKLRLAKQLHIEAATADNDFQGEAREDFKFVDNDQWPDIDKKILEEERRPCMTWNLIGNSVQLVMGLNEDTRVRYFATPVEPGDDFLCEVLNDTSDFVRKKAGAEEAEDDVFESSVICGRGWGAIDFNPDPKRLGHILVEYPSIPVHEVRKDPSARRKDNKDAGYIFWEKWITAEDFKIRHQKHASHLDEILKTGQMSGPLTAMKADNAFEIDDLEEEDTSDYNTPLDINYFDKTKRMVRMIHMEYWQAYKRYYGFHPETGESMEFERKNLKKLEAAYPQNFGQEFEYVTMMDKKVKWLQFIGDRVIYDGDSPLPYDGFSIVPCFAYSDPSKRTGNNSGIVRAMKDPQKEVNKRWSQTLNWLNNQVQPGVYVEDGAFMDQASGEASLKKVGGITLLTDGAIGEQKIMDRKVPALPAAPMALEEAAQNMMKRVSPAGNPDLLGMDRGRQEPGIVIRLRQQQGMMLLKPLFKSGRLMQEALYKRTLAIIVKYMPDEQIMDILGQTDRYVIQDGIIHDKQYGQQANIRDLRNLKYNVDVEEAPANKSKRVMDLAVFMEMRTAGFEVDPEAVIEKLDISASDKKRWLDYMQRQEGAAQQAQQQQFELEMMKIRANMESDTQKVGASTQLGYDKLDDQIQKGRQKHQIDTSKLGLEKRRQELDFIVRNKQADNQKQQQQAKNKAA